MAHRSIIYVGKHGDRRLVFPSDRPCTIEVVGLSAGETITLEQSAIKNPPKSTRVPKDTVFIDHHPYWRPRYLTRPARIKISPDNEISQLRTEQEDFLRSEEWKGLFIYNLVVDTTITQECTILHAPQSEDEEISTLFGAKVFGDYVWGWRATHGAYQIARSKPDDPRVLEKIWTSNGSPAPADGDTVSFHFTDTHASLSVNGTELFATELPWDLKGFGQLAIVQRSCKLDDVPFYRIDSITPSENIYHEIPGVVIDADNPILSIYTPLMFVLNIPPTAHEIKIMKTTG